MILLAEKYGISHFCLISSYAMFNFMLYCCFSNFKFLCSEFGPQQLETLKYLSPSTYSQEVLDFKSHGINPKHLKTLDSEKLSQINAYYHAK